MDCRIEPNEEFVWSQKVEKGTERSELELRQWIKLSSTESEFVREADDNKRIKSNERI